MFEICLLDQNQNIVEVSTLTIRASLSIEAVIFAQSSSQQMFSSAVTTSAEQRANTLYSLDHEESMDFWVTWAKKIEKKILTMWGGERLLKSKLLRLDLYVHTNTRTATLISMN